MAGIGWQPCTKQVLRVDAGTHVSGGTECHFARAAVRQSHGVSSNYGLGLKQLILLGTGTNRNFREECEYTFCDFDGNTHLLTE
jgi:hypothetical protein